jgi:hypothetical protein
VKSENSGLEEHNSAVVLFCIMQHELPRKPVILLDVDGVINMSLCIAKAKWPDSERAFIDSFFVHYSATVVQHINTWSEVAEIRWLTTWSFNAATKLAPLLNINNFTVEVDYLSKVECAIAVAAEVGPECLVIWIDDDIKKWKFQHDTIRSAKFAEWERVENGIFNRPNTVLLSPMDGLIQGHLDLVSRVLTEPQLAEESVIIEFEEECEE